MSITSRQKQALALIFQNIVSAGSAPTLRQLGKALGSSSDQAVIELLGRLEKAGLIQRNPSQARGIVLTSEAYLELGVAGPCIGGSGVGVSEPFRLEDHQQMIFDKLSELDPRYGRWYRSALRVLTDRSNDDRVAQSAHSLREITDHLSKTGKNLLSLEEAQHGKDMQSTNALQLEKVFDPLGGVTQLGPDVYDQWNHLHKYFVALAHHGKDPLPEELREKLQEFEFFLVEYILPSQPEAYDSLDVILTDGPAAANPEHLRRFLTRNSESYRYFFTNASAAWLQFLMTNGFISASWPVAEFLLRIAPDDPEAACEAIIQLNIQNDPRIAYRLVEAANLLPLDLAAKVICQQIIKNKWIRGEAADLIDRPLIELLKKFIVAQRREGIWLLSEMLAIRPVDNIAGRHRHSDIKGYFDEHAFGEVLEILRNVADADLAPFIDILAEKLHETLALGGDTAAGRDYSTSWRSAIEDHEQNWNFGDIRDRLVTGLRNLLERHIEHLRLAQPDGMSDAVKKRLAAVDGHSISRRLKLHIYRVFPDLFREQIDSAALSNFDDMDTWHEYSLLMSEQFPVLGQEVKKELLRQIERGPHGMKDDNFVRYWKARRLAMLKNHLTEEQRGQFPGLLHLEIEHPDFLSTHGSWHGPTSPIEAGDFSRFTIEQIVQYLINWTPEGSYRAPSREGLGRVLETTITNRAEEFSRQACLFADRGLRPGYLYHYFSALRTSVQNGRPIQWKPVIELMKDVISRAKAGELEKPSRTDQSELEASWDSVLQEIAGLLEKGLQRDGPAFTHRKDIWRCIEYLCEHPEPTAEYEARHGREPFTLSFNSVRGVAFHALFAYLLWCNRQTNRRKAQSRSRISLHVRRVLKKHLESDPSPTIRSVYGRYFPWLYTLDPAWVQPLLDLIFSPGNLDLRYAAWETYLSNAVFADVYHALRSWYELAIEDLKRNKPDRRYWVDPTERLAAHVIIAYAFDLDREKPPLYELFFQKASGKQRGQAVNFGGRAYIARDEFPKDEEPPADKARLGAFWKWRLESSSSVDELREFGWWMKVGFFPQGDEWMMLRLVETLEKTSGEIAADFRVIKAIGEMAAVLPSLAARACYLMLRSKNNKKTFLFVHHKQVYDALVIVWMSQDDEARKLVGKIIDYLTKLGYHQFRNIIKQRTPQNYIESASLPGKLD